MQNHKFEALDGLRGLFAVSVVLYHFRFVWHLSDTSLLNASFLAVDFFFVLSGFVITHATWGKLETPRSGLVFAIRRFGRVWPLHVAVLGGMILLEIAKLALLHGSSATANNIPFAAGGETTLLAIPAHLLLVQSFNLFSMNTWNSPSWSISTEFYTYLLFAAVSILNRKYMVYTAVALIVGSAAILFIGTPTMDTSYSLGIFRCIMGFFIGHLVYRLWKVQPQRRLPSSNGLEIGCMALIGIFAAFTYETKASLLAPLVFAIPIWVLAYQRGIISHILQTSPLQQLGKWSYSIYMVHYPIFICVSQAITTFEKATGRPLHTMAYAPGDVEPHKIIFFGNIWVMDLLILGCLTATILTAALATRFIETPARIYFNNLAKKWQKA